MESMTLICTDQTWFGLRLDKFLTIQFSAYSRSYFQQLIDSGHVHINAKKTKNSYCLKQNDVIGIDFKTKEYNLTPQNIPFDIIDIQDDFIVINKPAGLLVHPAASSSDSVSLINGLLFHFNDLTIFSEKDRPGIVHRLDKNTSGLLIIARNQYAHRVISDLFKNRKIKKFYLAFVSNMPPSHGHINLPIGRSVKEPHKMTTFGINAKQALTYYKTIQYFHETNSALICLRIMTGRTHQIRVHCSAKGFSVIGDHVYGKESSYINRQALHAWKIQFAYNNKEYTYTCAIPDDMDTLKAALSKKQLII